MTSHTIQSKNYSSRDTVGIFPMEFTLDEEQFLVMKDGKRTFGSSSDDIFIQAFNTCSF